MSVGIESSIGKTVFVEIPLSDGYVSGYLGRIVEVTPMEICLQNSSLVSHTGRRHVFMRGELDDNAEIEPDHPEAIRRLPRWGAQVTDWPGALPTEAK